MKKSSPISKLNPVLDDGLLMVGGRLSRTASQRKENIQSFCLRINIFPYWSSSTFMNRRDTVGEITISQDWERNIGSRVLMQQHEKVLSSCTFCKWHRGKLCHQEMSDLPMERITPDSPTFTNIGVDYFGAHWGKTRMLLCETLWSHFHMYSQQSSSFTGHRFVHQCHWSICVPERTRASLSLR